MIKKSQIRDHYNTIADHYGKRYDGLLGRYFHAMEEECIYQLANFTDKFVLDMGTGTGRLAFSLIRKGRSKKVIGIDIAERSIGIANSSVGSNEDVHFYVMDAETTAFRDSTFDAIVVLGLFEYVEDLSGYIKEIGRILNPMGDLIFTCWNRNRWFGWRIFDNRMKGSVDHSLTELNRILSHEQFEIESHFSAFCIPTRLFFSLYYRFSFHELIQRLYVKLIIAIERGLRKSVLKQKGGELIIKAQKVS